MSWEPGATGAELGGGAARVVGRTGAPVVPVPDTTTAGVAGECAATTPDAMASTFLKKSSRFAGLAWLFGLLGLLPSWLGRVAGLLGGWLGWPS